MSNDALCTALPATVYALGSSPWFARKSVNGEDPSDIKRNMRVSDKTLFLACFVCEVPR